MNLVNMRKMQGGKIRTLFTLPLEWHDKIKGWKISRNRLHHCFDMGAALVTQDGQEITLKAQGWTAFEK